MVRPTGEEMMLPGYMKKYIEQFIMNDCDSIIVDILKQKLDVKIYREGDDITFTVNFADYTIAQDIVNIK